MRFWLKFINRTARNTRKLIRRYENVNKVSVTNYKGGNRGARDTSKVLNIRYEFQLNFSTRLSEKLDVSKENKIKWRSFLELKAFNLSG